jgi:ketosteroid isomerase-like protein
MRPEDFPKAFATAFAAKDSSALAEMLAPDAQVVTLTGAVAEDGSQARQAFEQEFAGVFASAKLVTGRNRLRAVGSTGVVVHQRLVVMGARDATGRDLPRFGAAMTAVLMATSEGWRVVSLTLSALS